MDDRRGNLKCHSPWDYKIVRHSWERHLSRENLTSRSGHSCENHLSRRKPNLMISNDKHRKPLSIETPGINSASELSLLKVCFCIQQCTPCFSHKTSKNRECWLCVSPRCLCTYGWGNAHSYLVRVRHDKGKSGSSVCRSFHESGWRVILRNTTFKRNLQ